MDPLRDIRRVHAAHRHLPVHDGHIHLCFSSSVISFISIIAAVLITMIGVGINGAATAMMWAHSAGKVGPISAAVSGPFTPAFLAVTNVIFAYAGHAAFLQVRLSRPARLIDSVHLHVFALGRSDRSAEMSDPGEFKALVCLQVSDTVRLLGPHGS